MRFQVSDVKTEFRTFPGKTHANQMSRMLSAKCESVSSPLKGNIIETPPLNQFAYAVGLSFARHYPLVLSPDSVWLTISQGLANHINEFTEDVRKKFVVHEGKVQIVIQRDKFIKGSQDNDWEGAFEEFSARIKEHIGPANHSMIVSDFTTTGPVERAASEVVLMDAMKSYFEYGCMTMCGIPNIELLGTVEDWEKLRSKVNGWVFEGRAELSWWTTPIKRILDEFVQAAKGVVNKEWWESFYKENGGLGSGSRSKISGWINWLFPYKKVGEDKLERNRKVGVTGLKYGDGMYESDYPSSLAKVPFQWNYYGEIFDMELIAGLSAVTQDKLSSEISPMIGWGVREIGKAKKSKINWTKGS